METLFADLNQATLTFSTAAVATLIALVAGIVGGIAGGIIVGGKDLGYELAAMFGGFYGPIAALPGVVVALIVLALI